LWLEAANDNQQTALRQSLAMLASGSNPEGMIQAARIRLGLMFYEYPAAGSPQQIDDWHRQESARADELRDLLSAYQLSAGVISSEAFQGGAEALAIHYISGCSLEDAVKWFSKEIHVRDQVSSLTNERLWLRPPEKLTLYYMLCPNASTTGGGVRDAQAVLNQYKECLRKSPQAGDDNSPSSDLAQIILADYGPYKERGPWRKGTVLDDKVTTELKTDLLEKGWRY